LRTIYSAKFSAGLFELSLTDRQELSAKNPQQRTKAREFTHWELENRNASKLGTGSLFPVP
jgi:hypothetical protein